MTEPLDINEQLYKHLGMFAPSGIKLPGPQFGELHSHHRGRRGVGYMIRFSRPSCFVLYVYVVWLLRLDRALLTVLQYQ